jgi:predicted DNA-binding transcriptional regulator AlpA
MENLTLETLPKAFTFLTHEVSEIKRLLLEKSNEQPTDPDRWFDLTELCNYLPDKPAKATAYGWVHTGAIPCHKGAKKLRFLKSEIDQWLKTGKRKTVAELASEAESYLKKKGGKVL